MDIIRDSNSIYISQESYIHDCLKRFGFNNPKIMPTPFDSKKVLVPNPDKASAKVIHDYQVRIGTLIWVMIGTRPDIGFAVLALSRFASNPAKEHVSAL
jgi:hypothetical protein